MTNHSFASETNRRNITWAEVASLFHLEHLGKKHTVEPVTKNKKPPEEVSDAELVAQLNRVYNPDVGEAVISEAERDPVSVGEKQNRLPDYPDEYEIGSGWLYVRKTNGKVEQVVRLCNFFPQVKTEIVCDDGVREDRMFRVGILARDGSEICCTDVHASDLEDKKWIMELPSVCQYTAVGSVEKHIAVAVRSTGPQAEQKHIYAYTGFKKIDGKVQYLLPGHPLYDVELEGSKKGGGYCMEEGCTDADLYEILNLLRIGIAPDRIIYPLMALVFLTPLNELLREAGMEPGFVFTLVGKTGARKSSLAALFLSFFGKFNLRNLPMSFNDTPNSVLYNAGRLKDVLTCVDDFHPRKSGELKSMTEVLETVIRGYGDRIDRGRLTSEIKQRKSVPPQGNVIVTAEFIPGISESSQARLFCVEMDADTISRAALTVAQRIAKNGSLCRGLHSYVTWIIDRFMFSDERTAETADLFRRVIESTRDEWQTKLNALGMRPHGRLTEAIADLLLGFHVMVKFLVEKGIMTQEEGEAEKEKLAPIFLDLARKQVSMQEDDKPTSVYIRNLFAMINSGMLCLSRKSDLTTGHPNNHIGYRDDDAYYIFLERSVMEVNRFCDQSGEGRVPAPQSLAKQLRDEGILIPHASGRNTDSKRFGRETKTVMILSREKVEEILGVSPPDGSNSVTDSSETLS